MPEHLHIPFSALRQFVDPSVKFGLEFEVELSERMNPTPALPAAEKKLPDEGSDKPSTGAVVSLDSFRKK
jgi:hypothetical protein